MATTESLHGSVPEIVKGGSLYTSNVVDVSEYSSPSSFAFSTVQPVDVQLKSLGITYRPPPPPWTALTSRFHSSDSGKEGTNEKIILNGINASMPAGSLTAIIGSSGSGKTTLLNSIAHGVNSSKLKITGEITYNGFSTIKSVRSAYVMQQDILLPSLTVRETLQYAADLRLAAPSSKEGRYEIVEGIIRELGLKDCANTRIGSHLHKGCSGGEKRRTSIGVQMLANPSLLFCDEPTTGLDAHSAYQIVRMLKRLAENGRTVIISIHSPRSEIWALFDRTILLSGGSVLYSGEAQDAVPYFQTCGYSMPSLTNPAEFLIDLAALDLRTEDAEQASRSRVEALKQHWYDRSTYASGDKATTKFEPDANVASEESPRDERVGFVRQLETLTRRSTILTLRDPSGTSGLVVEAILIGIIGGWIFHNPGKSLAGVRTRQGAMYTASGLQPYLMLLVELFRLTADMQVFDRERAENAVGVTGFLLSRRLSKLLLEDIPIPLIYTVIFYFLVGLRPDAPTFFIFLAVNIISHYSSMALAALCVAFSRDLTTASLIGNLVFTVQSYSCGYFVQSDQISIWIRWVKWVAYNWYTLGSLVNNEFIGVHAGPLGQTFDCPYPDIGSPACAQFTGRFIVSTMGFPSNWIWRPIIIAIALLVGVFILAGFVLKFSVVDIGVAGEKKKKDDDVPLAKIEIGPKVDLRPITVGLNNYGLEVQKKIPWKRKANSTILRQVNATFEPGKLNVIMGPSGSGKTSLFQSIATRLHGNLFTTFKTNGDVTINGAVPGPDVLNSLTSFVTQDDDALMSCLTVRETLQFAAALRLPSWMTKVEKNQRAEDVLLKMGLKDCADRFIGSDLKKGISGGEKRRVSIATQILTDPRVLLLDEPTSGLDAFLASSVFDVLRALADEGRTIIVTVHQARSDLFKTFDNVLLLTRGGSVAYSGPGDRMLPHFHDSYDVMCPQTTNPADFALELITVNLQQQELEDTSRERVTRIVDDWANAQHSTIQRDDEKTIATPAELSSMKRQMNSFFITLPILLHRAGLNIARDANIIVGARIMQVLGIGIVMTLWFAPLQHNYEAIQSRMGLVQQLNNLYFVGMLQNLAVYPAARETFYREHSDRCYSSTTFLLSYTILELPFTALSSLIFSLLVTFATGLSRTAPGVFASALNTFAIVTCGESLGIIFNTIFRGQDGFAINVMSTFLSIAGTMAGVMSLRLPVFLSAMNRLSPARYLVRNMAPLAMRGMVFSCSEAQKVDGVCPLSTGEDVLRLYGLDSNIGVDLGAVVVCVVVYRLVAFVVLWIAKRGPR